MLISSLSHVNVVLKMESQQAYKIVYKLTIRRDIIVSFAKTRYESVLVLFQANSSLDMYKVLEEITLQGK